MKGPCNALNFQFINSGGEVLQDALQEIENCNLITYDSEYTDDTLSLVQIATERKVYIFDALVLKAELFVHGLKRILESTSITKIFYDCRGDSNILKKSHGVTLRGVIDAALAEVYYRYVNRMGVPKYLKGYKKSVEVYLPSADSRFHALKTQVSNQMSEGGPKFWKERPLSSDALEYAAYDVRYLRDLFVLLSSSFTDEHLHYVKHSSLKFSKMEVTTMEDASAVPSFFLNNNYNGNGGSPVLYHKMMNTVLSSSSSPSSVQQQQHYYHPHYPYPITIKTLPIY